MRFLLPAKEYIKANPHIYLLLFFPAFIAAFFALERHIPSPENCIIIRSPLDAKIPFLEIFVIPYCIWYVFLAATPILLLASRDAEGFKKHMHFMTAGFFAALLICFLFPNAQLLRPEPLPRDNIFTRTVAALYRADTPTNVFPSMHVIGCIAGVAACFHSRALKKLRITWVILAVLISLSTVFIKQHSVLDIFGAVALCIPIWLCLYLKRGRKRTHAPQQDNEQTLRKRNKTDDKEQ